MQLRCRNGNVPTIVTPGNDAARTDFTLTTQRELDSFYLLRFAFGPAISVVYVFFPLLLAVQGKYLAAGNAEGIIWKRNSVYGETCGDMGTLIEDQNPFQRPAQLPVDCLWFPNNPKLADLGVHYAALVAYAMAVMLLCAGMAIWVLSPFADGGVVRQHILHAGLLVWPMLHLFMLFSENAEDLWINTAVGVIAGVVFLFSLKAILNGYVPLLIGSHPDVVGVELLASPRSPEGPLSFRSMSAAGTRDVCLESYRSTAGRDPLCGTERQHKPDDMLSIFISMVTPRSSRKPTPAERPAGVPKLNLASLSGSDSVSPTPKLDPQGGLGTGRILEMEGGCMSEFEEYGDSDQSRVHGVVDKLLTHAASAEVSGQGAGIALQILLVLGALWCFPESNEAFPYLISIGFAALWAWAFGTYGYSGLKARTIRSSIEGFSCMDSLLVGVKRVAMDSHFLKAMTPNLFKLQLAQAIFNVVVRALQMMGVALLVIDFGFRPSKVALMMLVYGIVNPLSNIVSFLLLGMSATTERKISLLKIFAALLTICPIWICFGMHSSIEIVACTLATSALSALIPATIWSLQSDMSPRGHMTKVVSVNGAMEAMSLWIGPLLIGLTVDLTGSLRFGILILSAITMISAPLLLTIDIKLAMVQREDTEGVKGFSKA